MEPRADKKRKEDSTFVSSGISTHCWFNILSCSKGVTSGQNSSVKFVVRQFYQLPEIFIAIKG
jgi:hypothetical protein